MFQQLASYLTQYKQVSIPQVGSFELVAKPATLDVASKLIHPPSYLPKYSDKDFVKEHQLIFLARDLNADKDHIKEQLEDFGKNLRGKIQQGTFSWKGIGKLEVGEAAMVFHPDVVEIKGFQSMPADKVLRKNVQHVVRRGEQQVLSSANVKEEEVARKKSVVELIGWAVAFVSIIFIVVFVLKNGATATGTKMKVHPSSTFPTHK